MSPLTREGLGLFEYLPKQVGLTKAILQLYAKIASNISIQLHWISISSLDTFNSHTLLDTIILSIIHPTRLVWHSQLTVRLIFVK
jgi:hypothetical protein